MFIIVIHYHAHAHDCNTLYISITIHAHAKSITHSKCYNSYYIQQRILLYPYNMLILSHIII